MRNMNSHMVAIMGKTILLQLFLVAFYLLSLTSVSDVLVFTKPSIDHNRHEQSHSVTDNVTKILNYVAKATMCLLLPVIFCH